MGSVCSPTPNYPPRGGRTTPRGELLRVPNITSQILQCLVHHRSARLCFKRRMRELTPHTTQSAAIISHQGLHTCNPVHPSGTYQLVIAPAGAHGALGPQIPDLGCRCGELASALEGHRGVVAVEVAVCREAQESRSGAQGWRHGWQCRECIIQVKGPIFMSLAVCYPYLVRQTAQTHTRLSWLRIYGDVPTSSFSMMLPRWMRVPVNLSNGVVEQPPNRAGGEGLSLLMSTAGTYTTGKA
jgi:hypothetical protein